MDKCFTFHDIVCDTGEVALDYWDYLQTQHWQNLREKVYEQRNHTCQRCHKEISVFQIHHITYVRIGHERVSDVQLVCVKCHEIIHKRKDRLREKKYTKRRRRRKDIKITTRNLRNR
jgi:5-methylcytosine-specific restriction endonuclease McrA